MSILLVEPQGNSPARSAWSRSWDPIFRLNFKWKLGHSDSMSNPEVHT